MKEGPGGVIIRTRRRTVWDTVSQLHNEKTSKRWGKKVGISGGKERELFKRI